METENDRIARMYHNLDPNDVDEILTQDFKGEHWGGTHTWDIASHRKYLESGEKRDTIHEQFGDGDQVCTRFTRIDIHDGKNVAVDVMHVKQLRNGKIARILEMINFKQVEEQMAK